MEVAVVTAEVAAAVVAEVVALVVVVLSLEMILSFQIVRFSVFLKRRSGRTDLRTDGQTLVWRSEDASKQGQELTNRCVLRVV